MDRSKPVSFSESFLRVYHLIVEQSCVERLRANPIGPGFVYMNMFFDWSKKTYSDKGFSAEHPYGQTSLRAWKPDFRFVDITALRNRL